MTQKEKAAPSQSSPNLSQRKNSTQKVKGKLDCMLYHFSFGIKLQRFQAERLGDHCLHTTISNLQQRNKVQFSRKWTEVKNRFGSKTRVMLYWLEGEDLSKVEEIVELEKEVI